MLFTAIFLPAQIHNQGKSRAVNARLCGFTYQHSGAQKLPSSSVMGTQANIISWRQDDVSICRGSGRMSRAFSSHYR